VEPLSNDNYAARSFVVEPAVKCMIEPIVREIREMQGEYNFSAQYQQAPAPLGGGMVKYGWFKMFTANDLPSKFDFILQSWDTANKPTQLADYSVCTTWESETSTSICSTCFASVWIIPR